MLSQKSGAFIIGLMWAGSLAFAPQSRAAEPILFQDFENDTGQWKGVGGSAAVYVTKDAENIKTGHGALQFSYTVQAGQFEAMTRPLPKAALTSLQSIKFWIKSSRDTTILLALQEEGGGRFATIFSVAKDKWQNVEVAPADFLLQDGPNDPKDANGKLDLEKIEFIGLIDFDQVLMQLVGSAPEPIAQMLRIPDGPRTLYLDDVTLSSQPLPAIEETPDAASIDLFQRPQVEWASIGGATLERLQAKDPKDNALKVTYPQAPGRLMALIKPVHRGALAGKKQLTFRAASMKPTTFFVQLEETGGGKYNASFTVPGNATPTPLTLNFADFKTSQDSNDTNDHLDLDQVKQMFIADISGLMGGGPEVIPGEVPGEEGANGNTLWLTAVRAQ
jgi:hypothetical protein